MSRRGTHFVEYDIKVSITPLFGEKTEYKERVKVRVSWDTPISSIIGKIRLGSWVTGLADKLWNNLPKSL